MYILPKSISCFVCFRHALRFFPRENVGQRAQVQRWLTQIPKRYNGGQLSTQSDFVNFKINMIENITIYLQPFEWREVLSAQSWGPNWNPFESFSCVIAIWYRDVLKRVFQTFVYHSNMVSRCLRWASIELFIGE